jgi:hypothetical protein
VSDERLSALDEMAHCELSLLRVSRYGASVRLTSNYPDQAEIRRRISAMRQAGEPINWKKLRRASATARLRKGESIEAMVWRALAELKRRELDGNPEPNQKTVEYRRLRKLLLSADGQPS